jgi:GntR family transcriptional repressor for pyruvate dehydrogenase complex
MIEPSIARQAALSRTDRDLANMENDIKDMEKCTGEFQELVNLDMLFHQHLASATQNQVVPLILKVIQGILPELKSQVYVNIDDAKEAAIVWHSKIFNAVKAGDAEKAYQSMVEHLKKAEEHSNKVLQLEENETNKGEINE